MNTRIKCLIFACVALLSAACAEKEVEYSTVEPEGVEMVISAVREGNVPDTRTVRESDGSVEWCPADEISVFYTENTTGGSRFTCQSTEQTAIAEFKGRLDGVIAGGEYFTSGKYLYGVYPYSTNTKFKDGVTTITLSSNQRAVEGTFANGLFPTIARSQNMNLAFYNICGGVKFMVSREDITSVSIKGNNDERLAGTANVTLGENGKPVVLTEEVGEDGSKKGITVYAPGGGTFEPGKEYYIVAYPVKLSSGYTMTFRTTEMKEGSYVSNSEVEIQRSVFGVLDQKDKNVTEWIDLTSVGGGENSGIYLGIMGFNQALYPYPISELSDESKDGFDSFIDSLNMKYGTLLYYSVDRAINTLQSVPLPTDLSTVAVVTFTDGLDQGSMMMNVPYNDDNEYLDALNQRIKNETVSGQSITAYSIGIRGQDVSDVTMFRNNLKKLASSDANATEVTSMTEVNAKFKEIAEQLSKSNYIQTINLKMPGVSNGTKVRFTFDNVGLAQNSTLYLEGTFNLATRSLENVVYVGLTSTSGTEIQGTVDGIFVSFTFEGVHTDNNKLIDSKFTDEWTYITSNGTWQINSEFDKTENSDIVTERSSAVIMLVLDCSSSLADQFVNAQRNAKDFINTLYEAIGGENGSEENPGGNNNTIYSTIPTDLSLAIWKDGTRYYLSKEEYDKANLSNVVVEGLTIVSGGESFILERSNVQSYSIKSIETAKSLYGDIMPTAEQGRIISAKWSDINSALSKFGGNQLSSDNYYYTSSTTSSSSYSYTDCISGSGGNLYSTSRYLPYVRGVKSTNWSSAIYWKDPDDMKLSVIIDGTREFLNEQEYNERKGEIETIEGIAIIAGGEKFALHLINAQTDAISSITTAQSLYGDIMPTAEQGKIISAKWSEINLALSRFGGDQLNSSSYYYTSSTTSSSNYTNCIYGSGGNLSTSRYSPYVRGVTTFE